MVRKIILFLITAMGISQLHFGNEPEQFHSVEPIMAQGEKKIAEATGMKNVRFKVVDLENWQHENARLKTKLGEAKGEFLQANDLPNWMTFKCNGRDYLILPAKEGISLKTELTTMFSQYAKDTYRLLGISLAILTIALILLFKRKFIALALPVLAAVISTAGMLGWLEMTINFFHLLCGFVLIGIGIDYAIFHSSAKTMKTQPVSRTVKYGFLTSLIGFGMLAFTSFKVTASMGITLALGLFFAYVYSLPKPEVDSTNWAKQPEIAAGRLRIAFMFWLIKWLGRDVAKVVAGIVVVVAYPIMSRHYGIRKTLNFAWSLIDKSSACAGYGKAPKFIYKGDEGWKNGGAFLISTHVGCIEVLPFAGNEKTPRVHAFQQLSHNAVYTKEFMRHLDPKRVSLHAVEEIGIETAVEMQTAIQHGELVLMAGDREPASGGKKGVFRFAKLMEAPVYAITCISIGWNQYEVNARKLGNAIEREYDEFLNEATRHYPNQHYDF